MDDESLGFLESISAEVRRPEQIQALFDTLGVAAQAGDPEAAECLSIAEFAEESKEAFDLEVADAYYRAGRFFGKHCADLFVAAMCSTEADAFMGALQKIMRDAFARGWRARDKQND